MKIYYLGPKYSYSHVLVRQLYDKKKYQITSCNNFSGIVANCQNNPESIGVLPVENSTTSNVHENIEMLFNSNLYIVGEAYLKISLNLIGLLDANYSSILKVYSHQKALEQASKFILRYKLETEAVDSTSEAKRIILSQKIITQAFIGGNALSHEKNLKILKRNISNSPKNFTRFLVVSAGMLRHGGNKISTTFMLPHRPGSLAGILAALASNGANLTKIESRPIAGTNWEYQFWLDIETSKEQLSKIIDLLQNNTHGCIIKGVYSKGNIFQS